MSRQVDFIAHSNWMWHDGAWVPECIAFAPVYEANIKNALVVRIENNSLNKFSYRDVLKNLYVYPLSGFPPEDDEDAFETFRAPLDKLEEYLGIDFYNNVLKGHNSGFNVSVGTHDFATFMFLEPLFPEKTVFFLGDRWNAPGVATEQAQKLDSSDWGNMV